MRLPPAPFDINAAPIPKHAEMLISSFISSPASRLMGLSVNDIMDIAHDNSPAWLTGSSVWFPAAFAMQPPSDCDFDIVFSHGYDVSAFLQKVLRPLSGLAPPGHAPKIGLNNFGGVRIVDYLGNTLMDLWVMEENRSIEETLLGYPPGLQYIRAAFSLEKPRPATPLTRIFIDPSTLPAAGQLPQVGKSSYPGCMP